MRNIKRGRKTIVISLGKVRLTKKILCDVEKIVLKRVTPKDHFILLGKPKGIYQDGRLELDRARMIPMKFEEYTWAKVVTKSPNISVQFSPQDTDVHIVRAYSKGLELENLNQIGKELEMYLASLSGRKSYLYEMLDRIFHPKLVIERLDK